jgi:hypothetical protein
VRVLCPCEWCVRASGDANFCSAEPSVCRPLACERHLGCTCLQHNTENKKEDLISAWSTKKRSPRSNSITSLYAWKLVPSAESCIPYCFLRTPSNPIHPRLAASILLSDFVLDKTDRELHRIFGQDVFLGLQFFDVPMCPQVASLNEVGLGTSQPHRQSTREVRYNSSASDCRRDVGRTYGYRTQNYSPQTQPTSPSR